MWLYKDLYLLWLPILLEQFCIQQQGHIFSSMDLLCHLRCLSHVWLKSLVTTYPNGSKRDIPFGKKIWQNPSFTWLKKRDIPRLKVDFPPLSCWVPIAPSSSDEESSFRVFSRSMRRPTSSYFGSLPGVGDGHKLLPNTYGLLLDIHI